MQCTLSNEEVYEVRVVDNVSGRVKASGKDWITALNFWMNEPFYNKPLLEDPKVERIGIITGFVQKFISLKKYKKFDTKTKGGAFGVNVGGNLYLSSSEFSLDIVYGLDIAYLRKTTTVKEFQKASLKENFITNEKHIKDLNTKLLASTEDNVEFLNNPTIRKGFYV